MKTKTFVCSLGQAMKVVGLCLLGRTRWKILQHFIHNYYGASSGDESTGWFYISLLLVVLVLPVWPRVYRPVHLLLTDFTINLSVSVLTLKRRDVMVHYFSIFLTPTISGATARMAERKQTQCINLKCHAATSSGKISYTCCHESDYPHLRLRGATLAKQWPRDSTLKFSVCCHQ